MNTNQKLLGVVACGVALAFTTLADDTKQGSTAQSPAPVQMQRGPGAAEQKINQYINGNLFGIQNVKKDANKRIISLVSIGRAPLSSALTKTRAKNQARKKADANARAEFMKWLATEVTYTRVDREDIAIVQKGESLGDAGQGKTVENSEVTELTQEETRSVASGFVKGMIQIGSGMNEDGEFVVILGWNAYTADQMDELRDQNTPKPPRRAAERNSAPANNAGATGMPNKATSVSDAANDFL